MANAEKLIREGEELLNQYEYEEAYRKFTDALEEEETSRAYFARAQAGEAGSLGDLDVDSEDILEDFEKAIELDDNPFFRQAAGAFCIDMGKFEKAEEHYRQAVEMDPQNKHHYLSDLAVGYRFQAPVSMQELVEKAGEDVILRKSLNYMLEALDIDQEKAVELLSD